MTAKQYRLLVIHWFPLEQFPPAQNLLHVCSERPDLTTTAVTTTGTAAWRFAAPGVAIHRSRFPVRGQWQICRLLQFLAFPLLCLLRAVLLRPQTLLYYEPHSAPAAMLVMLLFPRTKLCIHCHEYRQLQHFRDRGNALPRLGFWLERRFLFRRAAWISHTNPERCELFLRDCPEVSRAVVKALPNLPPLAWCQAAQSCDAQTTPPIRLIYVGAVSLHDTYIAEIFDWLNTLPPKQVTLDLYISNCDDKTSAFLQESKVAGVSIHLGGLPYADLPRVLATCHLGLIIYKCTTVNYVYNAPNKLFEYLACGLNVLYPEQMLGVQPWIDAVRPQSVIPVRFTDLATLKPQQLPLPGPLCRPWPWSCENIYRPFLDDVLAFSPRDSARKSELSEK